MLLVALALLIAGAPAAQAAAGWSSAGSLATPREYPVATRLADGRVLVTGGYRGDALGTYAVASAELYDPATNAWSSAAPMATGRFYHTATLLKDGRVLVVGGISDGSVSTATAELYDPATDDWSKAADLPATRELHTATLLQDGRVLVAGGATPGGVSASALVYAPAADAWSSVGAMSSRRYMHAAALLDDGRVLVAGGGAGDGTTLATAELYDPAANTWSAAAGMAYPRFGTKAVAAPDGTVLVAGGGGYDGEGHWLAPKAAESYDPDANTWSDAGSLAGGRSEHALAGLPGGRALVTGGTGTGGLLASAEMHVPGVGHWFAMPPLATARRNHAAVTLQDGRVLVVGGSGADAEHPYLDSAEVFTAPDHVLGIWPSAPLVVVGDAVTATVGADAAEAGFIDAYAESGAAGCAATSAGERARGADDLGRITIPKGAASAQRTVPTAASGAYRLCAYLYAAGDPDTGAPALTAEATVTVVAPALDLSVAPDSPVAGAPVTATVTGETDRASYVVIFHESGATGCMATSEQEYARESAEQLDELDLVPGRFSEQVDVPSETAGWHVVCAYLYDAGADGSGPPRFLRSAALVVRSPAMEVTLSPGSVTVGQPVTATVAGEAGGASYIDIYAEPTTGRCAETSADEDERPASEYLGTLELPGGPFRETEVVRPDAPGQYVVCAYLYADYMEDGDEPVLLRGARFSVVPAGPATATTAGTGTVVVPPPPVVTPVDRTPPTVSLTVAKQGLRNVLAKGLALGVRSSERGQVCGAVAVTAKTRRALGLPARGSAKANLELGRTCATLAAPGRRTLQVRFRGKTLTALRKALRRHRSIAVLITATARDGQGNTATTPAKKLTLKP